MSSLPRITLLMEQNRYDLALSEIESLLADSPDFSFAHALRSLCLGEIGQKAEAETAARAAIELNPYEHFAFYALARAIDEHKRYHEALQAIRTAIELDPENGLYWRQQAFIQFARHLWKESLASTDQALMLNAEDAHALNLRAYALRALGRTSEAAEASQRALEIEPDLAMGHFEQGWALLRMAKPRVAEERFLEALRIDPNFTPAQEGLKEAIRSRFAPYRWITGYQHWLRRFPPRVSTGILLGAMLLVNLLPRLAPREAPGASLATTLVYAYVLFAYLTWIAKPLSNFFLALHPIGRYALTADEKTASWILGGIFLLTGVLATGRLTDPELYGIAIMQSLALAVPGTAIFQVPSGGMRWMMSALAILLLIAGPFVSVLVSQILITVDSPLAPAILFGAKNFWWGIVISTWIPAALQARRD